MGLKSWFNRNKKPAPPAIPAQAEEEMLPSIQMKPVVIPGGMMTGGMVVVPDPDPDVAGKKGSPEDIRRAYRKHASTPEKIKLLQKGIIESASATTVKNEKGWVRLAAYLECVEAALPKATDKEDHLRRMAAWVLNDIVRKKLSQSANDVSIDQDLSDSERQAALKEHQLYALNCKGLSPETRQMTLDLALRAAGGGNHPLPCVDMLIEAGADIATDGHRPLANAIVDGHHALARHLISQHNADITQARARADVVYKDKTPRDKFLAFYVDCALVEMTPESFKKAAFYGGSYSAKKPLLEKATEIYEATGNFKFLSAFMAGYMAFKREDQATAVLKDGYLDIAVSPTLTLMKKSADPYKVIYNIAADMPACDRQMLCNLLLRQVCNKGEDLSLVRATLAAGADVHTLAERPLINAATSGHTDIALMLVREYGARLGDAVLEMQTWTGDQQKNKERLYALMAHEYNRLTTQSTPLNLPVLGKQAIAAKRPTP